MSRCFPFPPPGYEKKTKTDDLDLLKKEKHKEKKHKKEKKDKEKREDENRKDKHKSDGKHRDKKDRKEKSKEKKDREREKNSDKSSSQEKKAPAQIEGCNGDHELNHIERERVKDQNITSNEKKQSTPFGGHIAERPREKFNEGDMDKFVLDLCGRIRDEEKGSASQTMERSHFTGRTDHDRMVKNENGIIPMVKKDRRGDDSRKMEGKGVTVGAAISASRPSTLVQNNVGKEIIENKGVYISRGFQNRAEEIPKISAGTLVQNVVGKGKTENGVNTSGGFQNRVEEFLRISEKNIEPGDKNHKKEGEDKHGSKRKDKDKEKKSHGKDKEREKEKKKEEKTKEKNAKKIKDQNKVKGSIANGRVVSQNIKLPLVPDGNIKLVPDGNKNLIVGPSMKLPQLVLGGHKNGRVISQNMKLPPLVSDGNKNLVVDPDKLPQFVSGGDKNLILSQNMKLPPFVQDGDRTTTLDGNLKKRKDVEANGFLLETNFVPNKKLRPTPHPSIENGRKLESCAPVLPTPDWKVPAPNNLIKVNNNQHKVNGKIEVQPLSISLKKTLSPPTYSRTKADQIGQASVVKPPHPDTKYLSKVLSVPKIDGSCDCDDEEWLFSSKGQVSSAGPTTEVSEMPRVWDKSMQIASADVCALPYVIPY